MTGANDWAALRWTAHRKYLFGRKKTLKIEAARKSIVVFS